MRIIGQELVKQESLLIAKDISRGIHHNIIIEGKSGYGKTTIARYISYLSQTPYQIILGNQPLINTGILIVDEAHLIKNAETLYPIMDAHYMTVIILTTEIGSLPEPLVNRCISVKLVEYTEQELILMCTEYSKNLLNINIIKEIVNRCRGVPRNIVNITERVLMHNRYNKDINIKVLLDSFGIYENGFTDLDLKYLEYLKIYGHASILTLSKALGVPKSTIENYIEPFLLRKNLVKITSKGRENAT